MKAHIGVDSKQGHVHSVCSTAASVADKHMLPDLLHGAERKVWGDGAYQGQMLSATDGAQTRVHRHFFKTLGIPLQATGNVVISQGGVVPHIDPAVRGIFLTQKEPTIDLFANSSCPASRRRRMRRIKCYYPLTCLLLPVFPSLVYLYL